MKGTSFSDIVRHSVIIRFVFAVCLVHGVSIRTPYMSKSQLMCDVSSHCHSICIIIVLSILSFLVILLLLLHNVNWSHM